ncbi:MAG: metallophosphoesterase, partial [Nanoarchaeota archaeon]|nr:metallophosphoesterase [Nanoarchaeota archaeon]
MDKKQIVSLLMDNNVLVSPDAIENLSEEALAKMLEDVKGKDLLVFNKDTEAMISKNIEWKEFEVSKTMMEKGNSKPYDHFLGLKDEVKEIPKIKVTSLYETESKKRTLKDFVSLFNARYESMESLLSKRMEMTNLTTVSRLLNKKDRDTISLIVMVVDKQTTKNGNLMLTVEDPTGATKVLISKNKPDLFQQAKDIVFDEMIAVIGVNGDNIIFANNVLWPEVPLTKELKKSPVEAYAIFLSDMHVGSTNFLPDDFNKFLKWINGELGNDKQKEIASKIRYAFIVGDLVDGCGIYPGQEDELTIKDITEQYAECARLLKQIPKHVNIIVCPGNHDAMRIAEPQPPLYQDFAAALYELPNVTHVSNPAIVNIHASEDFSGFDVLMYHGYSFDYYV